MIKRPRFDLAVQITENGYGHWMVLACGTRAHLSDRRLSGGLLELVAVYARTKPIHVYVHVCVCVCI